MDLRLLSIVIVIIFFIAGCATKQSVPLSVVSQMQAKIVNMERMIRDRDTKIQDLEYNLGELSSRVEDLEKYQLVGSDEELQDIGNDNSALADVSVGGNDGMIRVPITVTQLQQALSRAGYYKAAIDGKAGRKTRSAVCAFQRDHSLKVDGIVGRKTWSVMKKYLD